MKGEGRRVVGKGGRGTEKALRPKQKPKTSDVPRIRQWRHKDRREQAAWGSAALSSQGGEEMKEDKIPM